MTERYYPGSQDHVVARALRPIFSFSVYSTARYEKLHSETSPDSRVVFKHLPETGWEEVASVRPVLVQKVQKMSPGELRCSCVLDITALSCIFFAHNGLCT